MWLLALLWISGLVAFFTLTNERQRENILVVAWILLLLPAIVMPVMRLLRLW